MDRPHLRRRRNQNLTDKKAAGDDTHQSDSKTETESGWETLDFINDVNGDEPCNDDVKKKGVDTSCRLVKTNGKGSTIGRAVRGNKANHHAYTIAIWANRDPVVNDIMKRRLRFRLPGKFRDERLFVPRELMDQWRDAVCEARALASYDIIECPFGDCSKIWLMTKRDF
ncbi:hypothetical protein HAX54_018816 [Datura stramonium]|uniref:Uncharacterized protein n=1 Tax=Datura stramonium TaxID=4076 RepID=A0ABS8UNA2_DATST|nr:hypothetical protein [Datura stramonium]